MKRNIIVEIAAIVLFVIFFTSNLSLSGNGALDIGQSEAEASQLLNLWLYADYYEMAVEYPEMWDAGCVVMCYRQGNECIDLAWTGGLQYPISCQELK